MADSLGDRIRQARERLSYNQTILAEKAGFSSYQTISDIERGEKEVRASELVRLAEALKVDFSVLISEKAPVVPSVKWRERPESAEGEEANFLELCRRYNKTKEICGITSPKGMPKLDSAPTSETEAGKAAEFIAKQLNLGSRPAASLASVLENEFDVLIWYKDLGQAGSSACTSGEYGEAILINSNEAPWRRNFDLGHELYHLVTWGLETGDEFVQHESLANVFSSYLLLPADPVNTELDARSEEGNMDWGSLVELAREFEVSTVALLWRLKTLHRISYEQVHELIHDDDFKALDRSTMSGAWWNPPPIPERFVRLVFRAYMKGCLSRARLAKYLNTNLTDLQSLLENYNLSEDEDFGRTLCTA